MIKREVLRLRLVRLSCRLQMAYPGELDMDAFIDEIRAVYIDTSPNAKRICYRALRYVVCGSTLK